MRNRHRLAPFIKVLLHVKVEILENQVELVVAVYNVEQVDNGRVVELSEQCDLTNGCAGDSFIAVLDLDFFERYRLYLIRIKYLNFIPQTPQNEENTYLVELKVDRFENDAISALADLIEQLEALSTGLLLPFELLLGLGGFTRLLASIDAVADVAVAVTLHVGCLAAIHDSGRGLAN